MSMIGNLLQVTAAELEVYLNNSSLLEDRIYNTEKEDANLIDLDKAWEGIVYLLTGQSLAGADHPLLAIMFSGQFVDADQDLGYGPAHYLTPQQVKELNQQLSIITDADLNQRYKPTKMNELGIYPEIWDENAETFEYLVEYFHTVQHTYRVAADRNEAIITFVN